MTGQADAAFKALMADLSPVMRAAAWVGSGQKWQKPDPDNWVLWIWQKSRYSTSESIEFTGNLHVVTKDWYDSQNVPRGRVPDRPTPAHAGLGTRLGQMLPDQADTWWEVRGPDDVPDLVALLGAALTSTVFPSVDQQLAVRAAAQRECWHNVGGRNWFEKCGRPATQQRTVGDRAYHRCEEHVGLIDISA